MSLGYSFLIIFSLSQFYLFHYTTFFEKILNRLLEELIGTDSYNVDTDEDGLTDYQEYYITNTNPSVYDSVIDGVSDADADCDEDGLSNIYEIAIGTDPLLEDTDSDGLSDYEELYVYNTDPLVSDSDNDGLEDGAEIKLELDPTNPETFGTPDAEYTVKQTILADSEVFEEINTEDSPYELSIEIEASGYVEGAIKVRETGYSKAISNSAMLGIAPELKYSSGNVEDVTLKFNISSDYIENQLNLYLDEEELSGIKRFNIFKYVTTYRNTI